MDIKESKEVIEGLKVLAKFAGNVLEDGKVSSGDLTHLVSLALEFEKIAVAVKDAELAVAELKELSQPELLEIVSGFYGVFAEFKAAKAV